MSYKFDESYKTTDIKKLDASGQVFFKHTEIHAMFDQLIHKPWGSEQYKPLLDIYEFDDHFRIHVDLPGIDSDKIKVVIADTRLIIEGVRSTGQKNSEKRTLLKERPCGTFSREIEFHQTLSTKINKEYKDGVMTIKIAKM